MTFGEQLEYLWSTRGLLLESLGISLLIALGAIIIGFVIGVVVAVIRIAPKNNIVIIVLDKIAQLYITVIRGTPTMVQLLIMYSSIMVAFKYLDTNIAVPIVSFGINSGAYMAEIIRSGINSVDIGQIEAGRSVGLSWITTMWKIVIPQAIKVVVPTIFNEIIILVKETSVVSVIALRMGGAQKWDLLGLTNKIAIAQPATYNLFLYVAAAMYLIIVLLLTFLQKHIEKRMRKNERHH